MDSTHVFVSFDFVHDKDHRNLPIALSRAPDPFICFDCLTDDEANLNNVATAKAVRSQKIGQASHTLVVVGTNANKFHANHKEIGTRNWQWWEIEESDRQDKILIAVRLAPANPLPNVLFGKNPGWAKAPTVDDILVAIRKTCAIAEP
jgi:hypothetical protein